MAVNRNDIIHRTVQQGDFSLSEAVKSTLASAMDIQVGLGEVCRSGPGVGWVGLDGAEISVDLKVTFCPDALQHGEGILATLWL